MSCQRLGLQVDARDLSGAGMMSSSPLAWPRNIQMGSPPVMFWAMVAPMYVLSAMKPQA
jgi:hypothetical protein